MKIFEKEKVSRIRKEKDILMEKYVLEKLKDVEGVINLRETFKDEMNAYMKLEPVRGGEIWKLCRNFS